MWCCDSNHEQHQVRAPHLPSDSSLTSEDVASIKYPLSGSKLKTLSMSGNPIGDEGFHNLLFYLDTLSSLEYLHLQNCGITEASVPALTSFISSKPRFQITLRIASLAERSEHRRRSDVRRQSGRAAAHHWLQSVLRSLHQSLLSVEFDRTLPSRSEMDIESPFDTSPIPLSSEQSKFLECWKTLQALHWITVSTFPFRRIPAVMHRDMNIPLSNPLNLPMLGAFFALCSDSQRLEWRFRSRFWRRRFEASKTS